MSTELIINASLPETRIALQENGEIQELLIERASGKGIVGNIYKGRVTRVLPGMQAAFVDIGLEKAAFLYVDDVFVHSHIWEAEEDSEVEVEAEPASSEQAIAVAATESNAASNSEASAPEAAQASGHEAESGVDIDALHDQAAAELGEAEVDSEYELDDEDEGEDDGEPVGMGAGPDSGSSDDEGNGNQEQPQGTIAPESEGGSGDSTENVDAAATGSSESRESRGQGRDGGRRRRRGRGGAKTRRGSGGAHPRSEGQGQAGANEEIPENMQTELSDAGEIGDSDRAAMVAQHGEANVAAQGGASAVEGEGRPTESRAGGAVRSGSGGGSKKSEFNQPRSRDRRVRPKQSTRPSRANVNIQDLLKEGQEVIVQVAKDPIATKGARLTCHLSLPGRHLVCMPTIDHVGVSRRIERDDERRKLREYVERYRPKNLGFIVRTASGRNNSEQRIKQDIEYLTRIWNEIREKVASVAAPALVYEDLNSVLRAIRDWVTDEIDKIVVDSRYHHNEILRFVSHFMPSLKQKVELYHGDIPIFDAYNVSTELSRALERKVWLKSGGYLVIDQAEALVAIDVNTGRFVGKKNLEDTILKTNLEAVQEIAYQLRLRNCGGIIILDLIDMEKEENKQRVYRALEEALKKDRARPSILKISELGLVEMTRKRTRDTMVRALCESCSHCEGRGFVKSKQTVSYEILREVERAGIERGMTKVLIQAHPDVIDILAIDERETMDQLERRYRKQIYLQAVMDFHPEQFEVTGDKQEGVRVGASSSSQPAQERGREAREGGQERDRERGGRRDRDSRDRERGGRDRNRNRDRDRQQRGPGGPRPMVQGSGLQIQTQSAAVQAAQGQAAGAEQDLDAQPKFDAQAANGHADYETQPSFSEQSAPQASGSGHDDFEEEDRLAFQRAQAAQDAALAKLRAGGHAAVADGNRGGHGPRGQRPSGGGGGAGRNDRDRGGRRRRGRRGGTQGQGFNQQRGGFESGPRVPGQGAPVSAAPRARDTGSAGDEGGSSSAPASSSDGQNSSAE
ncbi:MAG: Rne/Rng family ribonuclease [Oligoflexia bacterium]|nr:Rne/Rng family ribonuclease [Oligoflexia bacterium]